MTRRTAWATAFLSVAAVWTGMELYAAFDANPDTDPATYLIRDHIPAAVTFALIAILAAHMHSAYAQKGTDVTAPVPPELGDRRTEPLLTRAGAVAVASALIGAAVSLHWVSLSDGQTEAILTAVGVAAPLAAAWWARRHVTPARSPD